jgi:hypothetical protein
MWWWILAFLAAFAVIAVIINRRGSTGASRGDDLGGTRRADTVAGGEPTTPNQLGPGGM